MLTIRQETSADFTAIYEINRQAFGQTGEAELVNRLRLKYPNIISLVAVQQDEPVGYILFSDVKIETESESFTVAGLAPLAVLPALQNQGIGSQLTHSGLTKCREAGYKAVVVLGHPDYYPRFGFVKSTDFGIKCEYDAPPEAFMVLELEKDFLKNISGIAHFLPEFNDV